MVENRRVGIKSRETYECPASLALILAHKDLESICLERDLDREKARIEPRYAELIYDGLWFSPLKEAFDSFVDKSQEFVTGEVRLRLSPDSCTVTGRRSEHSLYDYELATYDAADTFRHEDSAGFVRLWPHDIAGSRAHVRGLVRGGLLDGDEAAAIFGALDQVEDELAGGTFEFGPADEDIHTAVERRVTEIAGPAGGKIHTGRSRNDQVATDLRLYTKRALRQVADAVLALQQVLLSRADAAGDAYLPGYTHLQRAQPVQLRHHLLAHGWALARDVDRLLDTRKRADVSPLGAGALAGSSLPLDPSGTAADLGFENVFENSLDAVSDRDFVAEALFDLSLLGIHLSRIGEEV